MFKNISVLSVAIAILASCTPDSNPWEDYNQKQETNNNESQQISCPDSDEIEIEDANTSEDNIANTDFDAILYINYSGTSAKVQGEAANVTVSIKGAKVTATNSGSAKVNYVLSGTSTNGCFKLYSSKKQAITISNLNLENQSGAAINNQSKKRTFVVLEGANSLKDCAVNTSGNYPDENSSEDQKAAFFSEAQLIFSGTGSLSVTATGKAGITSDDYIRIMGSPKITVNSTHGHGIRGKDAIIIDDGTINVTVESTATGKKCMTTDSLMYIGGGNTTLVNNASAGTVDGEQTGASGIKSDIVVVMRGGELNITATGKGCKCISCDGNGYFEGGALTAKATGANDGESNNNNFGRTTTDDSTSSKAIKFDGSLKMTGCNITASAASHEAIEAKCGITITAGNISATASDDAINSGSHMTISGGDVYAYSTGNDGIDANGNLYIKGGRIYAIGTTDPEVGIDANTEGGYKFYLEAGEVIAIGGVEKNSSVSQAVISTSWSKNTSYTLCNAAGDVLTSFKTPAKGGTTLFISTPALQKNTSYSLKAEGGSTTSVTAGDYSSSGGNNPGGGGPGGGGPGGGGRWW